MSERPPAARRLAIASSLVLGVTAVLPILGAGGDVAQAQQGAEICPKSAGGFPLKSTTAWPSTTDFSTVSCAYDNTHKKRNQTYLNAEVIWHDVAAVEANPDEMNARFCDLGEAGESARLFYQGPDNAIDLTRLGDSRVYVTYAWGRDDKQAAAAKLATKLMNAVQGGATACPGATGGDEPGQRTIELVLSGERLQAVRDAGGVGAIIGLEGGQGYGLVLTDAEGNPVRQQDWLGTRGRVAEMGVSLVGEGGEEVVSVAVEVLPEEPASVDDPAIDPDPVDPTEPTAPDDPSDPAVPPEDAQDVPVDAGSIADEEPVAAEPTPAPTDDDTPAEEPFPAGLAEATLSQLDKITSEGRGTIVLPAGHVAQAAGLSDGLVSQVRTGEDEIELVVPLLIAADVFLKPEIIHATGDISARVRIEGPGLFGLGKTSMQARDVPGIGASLEQGLQAINAELRERRLRPTYLVISERGIGVILEHDPDR